MRRGICGAVAAVVVPFVCAPLATAAVTIGSMQQGTGGTSCSAPKGMVQANPPAGESYTAPIDGVITSFTFAGAGGGLGSDVETKLLVLEPVGVADYRVVAAGQVEAG